MFLNVTIVMLQQILNMVEFWIPITTVADCSCNPECVISTVSQLRAKVKLIIWRLASLAEEFE